MLVQHQVLALLRAFAALQAPKSLSWPGNISVATVHDFLLNSILLNPHFASYPPSAQYRKSFWKWAIENMEREISRSSPEADEFEIDERIYECYLGLLPLSGPAPGTSNADSRQQICDRGLPVNRQPPPESYLTHYWRSTGQNSGMPCPVDTQELVDISQYQTLTLLESQNLIEGGTTGLRTWPASFFLARYLTQHAVAFKRVLELGSGVGFLGALIATLQIQQQAACSRDLHPGSLYLTDINDEVLIRCQNNIRLECNLSSTHPDIRVRTLDWFLSLDCEQRTVLASFIENEVKPDVVLGADIVFDPFLIPALVGVLSLVLSGSAGSAKRHALIALTNRNPTTMDTFVGSVKDAGLEIVEFSSVILDTCDTLAGEENVYLFRVTAQGPIVNGSKLSSPACYA